MSVRVISQEMQGDGFISPQEVDNGKYIGSIFVVEMDEPDEVVGFVYHDVDDDYWIMETRDFISDKFESFTDLFENYLDEEVELFVKE
jgi:hypothetical protein